MCELLTAMPKNTPAVTETRRESKNAANVNHATNAAAKPSKTACWNSLSELPLQQSRLEDLPCNDNMVLVGPVPPLDLRIGFTLFFSVL